MNESELFVCSAATALVLCQHMAQAAARVPQNLHPLFQKKHQSTNPTSRPMSAAPAPAATRQTPPSFTHATRKQKKREILGQATHELGVLQRCSGGLGPHRIVDQQRAHSGRKCFGGVNVRLAAHEPAAAVGG